MSNIRADHQPGPSPAVVMIHGWTCRRTDWQAQLRHLKGRHECLAVDLPGHGETPADDRSDWSMSAFARDVLAAMDGLEQSDVILLGHSMGGTVALEAAAMAPHRVRGVILADTFLINYGALSREEINGFYQPFAEDFTTAMDGLIDNTTGPRAGKALKQQLKRQMGSADPAWALKAWEQLLHWNPASVFETLDCPAHAINCPLIPDTTRERLSPHMQDTVIPETGHFLHMEAPEDFNRALDKVISGMS